MGLSAKGYLLRAPEPEDLEFMYQFENTPSLWTVSNTTGPYSRYALKQYILEQKNDLYVDNQLRLMIENLEHQLVGIIDLFNFEPFHRRAEVGIAILPAYRCQGIATLALGLLQEYCFHYLGLHQLYAYVDASNEASLRLFSGCSFTECALLKEWMRQGKEYKDVKMLQCLASTGYSSNR